MINILIVGDVFGRVGRNQLEKNIPIFKKKYNLDFIIVNGENTTNGSSLNFKHYLEFKKMGIDAITMGNHTFTSKDLLENIDKMDDLIRPYNYEKNTPGKGTKEFLVKGLKLRVTNLLGRNFMRQKVSNPFYSLDEIELKCECDLHIVDFHAETTSEKIAIAHDFDGKITALVGTHTHVQTNDARLLNKGTFFITDIGMTGPIDSIIGAEPRPIIFNERTNLSVRFKPAIGRGQFCAVLIKIDEKEKKVLEYKVFFEKE